MRKLMMLLLCGICVTAFAAGACAADKSADAAKETGLQYFRALVDGDAAGVYVLVTEEFAAEIRDPAVIKYSHLTALLTEYPQTLRVMAAKTGFTFINTEKSDGWIDVYLEVVAPDMEYVGAKIAPHMSLPDEKLAGMVVGILNEPGLPMEKHKTELEMVLANGAWKVAAHTDFVGLPVKN